MKSFDQTHLILLVVTVAFVAATMWLTSKLPRKGQTWLFAAGALVCAGGIFLTGESVCIGMTVSGAVFIALNMPAVRNMRHFWEGKWRKNWERSFFPGNRMH